MRLRRAVVVAAAATLAVAGAAAVAQAQPSPGGGTAAVTAQSRAASAADNLVAHRASVLHAGADDAFTAHKVVSTNTGLQYVPYDRTYKGLPVVGGDFVVVTDAAGTVLSTSVAQEQTIDLADTHAKITRQTAEAVARGQVADVSGVEGTRLVVFALGHTPRLAWETTVSGRDEHGASRLTVVVDATTKQVLHTQEHVLNGTGTAGWNGPNPVSIATTQSGGTYLLRDPAHPTVQCQDAATNTTFSGPDDAWGNGDPSNRETACVDALFAAEKEEAMLSEWLGRNGFDGNGGGWPIRVGLNDLNAYYDGTQVQIGHNQHSPAQWITSLDVVAHELGHGIDDHTPGGISGSGTQEFVADVFGATTESYANEPAPYDTPDFLVGETIDLVGSGPIRNMYDPSQLGDKNCYDSSIPSTEVHAAAGPGNHWFYLLANGSSPTNGQPNSPTCNSSSVTGVGLQNAIKIMYNAMLMKTSGSSYLKYRTWTLTAAKNLDTTCGLFNATKAAWDAVSVPAQTADPVCLPNDLTVSGPGDQSGTVGTAVSIPLTVSGGTAPYHWTATGLPTGVSIDATTGLISGTPTTAGHYSVTALATDSSSPAKAGGTAFAWTVAPVSTPGCSAEMLGPVEIADLSTVEAPVNITGCAGKAWKRSTVEVHITHTYIGDLVLTLVAPDGSTYVLQSRTGGSTDDINQTYTVNLASEVANGVWTLRVQDAAAGDSGTLNSWKLDLAK